jgi:hypothetical protein
MIKNIPRMSLPVPKSRPTPRPAQVAPIRRGQPEGGDGLPCGGVVGRGDGCAPAYRTVMRPVGGVTEDPLAFAGGDED